MSDPRQDRELLAWVAQQIQDCQLREVFGTLTLHFNAGTIVRTETNEHKKPDFHHSNGANGKHHERT